MMLVHVGLSLLNALPKLYKNIPQRHWNLKVKTTQKKTEIDWAHQVCLSPSPHCREWNHCIIFHLFSLSRGWQGDATPLWPGLAQPV